MSTSISLEPSMSPTPSSQKMNGSLSTRTNHLNVSTLSVSKPSSGTATVPLGGGGSTGGGGGGPLGSSVLGNITLSSNAAKPLLDVSKASLPRTSPNVSRRTFHASKMSMLDDDREEKGIYEMLASLALMCLLSLLMAFLALFFLQKTGPMPITAAERTDTDRRGGRTEHTRIVVNTKEYMRVYQISVALSTLTISLDLCCLFVCCIQFLSAIKLLKTPQGGRRTNEFLKRSSHTRVTAIGGFLLSIPIFFTGVILFTFIHFDEVPALVTSIVIGVGIVFCGVASVQNVYLWQWEKTKASKELSESRLSQLRESALAPDVTAHTMELSTLV